MTDLREIGPTYYFAPPRVFETQLTNVMIRMEDARPIKKRMFDYFMAHARKVGPRFWMASRSAAGPAEIRLGELLVYGPLKNTLGFSRVRVGYTAGEAIGPEIFDFYRSLGINLKQLYGQTEATVFITAAARWRGARRYGRRACPGRGDEDRRQWRGLLPLAGRLC